jgi:hypothetical protein
LLVLVLVLVLHACGNLSSSVRRRCCTAACALLLMLLLPLLPPPPLLHSSCARAHEEIWMRVRRTTRLGRRRITTCVLAFFSSPLCLMPYAFCLMITMPYVLKKKDA